MVNGVHIVVLVLLTSLSILQNKIFSPSCTSITKHFLIYKGIEFLLHHATSQVTVVSLTVTSQPCPFLTQRLWFSLLTLLQLESCTKTSPSFTKQKYCMQRFFASKLYCMCVQSLLIIVGYCIVEFAFQHPFRQHIGTSLV